jgi:hypothetical protein
MALRTFKSGDGTTWNVWNVVPTLARDDRKLFLGMDMTEGWLCFESSSSGSKRRIVPVPEGWEAWSEHDLESALGRAAEVQRGSRKKEDGEAEEDAAGPG